MKLHLKTYLNTFREKKILTTFLIDALLTGILYFLFVAFGSLIQKKALLLTNGQAPEKIQEMLLTNPEQAQSFLAGLQSFLFLFIGGLILLLAITILLYSLAQFLIWNHLLNKKTTYWRWNMLNLALIIPSLVYLLLFLVIKILLNAVLPLLKSPTLINFLNNIIIFFFLFVFVLFLFLTYYSFAHKYKVWESIGEGFHLIKTNSRKLGIMLLLVLLTAVIIGFLNYPLSKLFPDEPGVIVFIDVLLSLLFLAWTRVYLVKTAHNV